MCKSVTIPGMGGHLRRNTHRRPDQPFPEIIKVSLQARTDDARGKYGVDPMREKIYFI